MSRHLVDCDGEKVSVAEYCKRKGLNEGTIKHFKCRHPNMTYEQIFKYYEENPIKQRAKNFRLHCIWKSMKDRCYNPKNPAYKHYGGKLPNPIKVCDRWLDYFNFEDDNLEEYLKQSEIYGEANVSIDRYNNDKWYMPSNCHWIPKYQQAWNKEGTHYFLPCNISLRYHCKVNNYNYNMVVYHIKYYNLEPHEALAKWIESSKHPKQLITLPTGETLTEFSKRTGVPRKTIEARIKAGWSLDRIVNTPYLLNAKREE